MIEPVSPAVLKASLFGAVIGGVLALGLNSLPNVPKDKVLQTINFVNMTLGGGLIAGRFAQFLRGE